jgi:transposase-like protein
MKLFVENHTKGQVHCPICTHTVPADIDMKGKYVRVSPGQVCPRCKSSLNVAVVIQVPEAA